MICGVTFPSAATAWPPRTVKPTAATEYAPTLRIMVARPFNLGVNPHLTRPAPRPGASRRTTPRAVCRRVVHPPWRSFHEADAYLDTRPGYAKHVLTHPASRVPCSGLTAGRRIRGQGGPRHVA